MAGGLPFLWQQANQKSKCRAWASTSDDSYTKKNCHPKPNTKMADSAQLQTVASKNDSLFMQDLLWTFGTLRSLPLPVHFVQIQGESSAAMANALDRNVAVFMAVTVNSEMTVTHVSSSSSDFFRSKVSKPFTAVEFLRLFDLSWVQD